MLSNCIVVPKRCRTVKSLPPVAEAAVLSCMSRRSRPASPDAAPATTRMPSKLLMSVTETVLLKIVAFIVWAALVSSLIWTLMPLVPAPWMLLLSI